MSEMVVNSLSLPTPIVPELETPESVMDLIDPSNSKIVTTAQERKVLDVAQEVLSGEDITGKDTESYYAILYQNKTNRWLLRYYGDRKRPVVQFVIPLTEQHNNEIQRAGLEIMSNGQIVVEKPENILRISGLLFDALSYCKNDDNFKVKKVGA